MKNLAKNLTLVIIVLSLFQCRKKDIKPEEPTPTPECTYKTSGAFEGKYHATVTPTKDTIQISFVKDNCPDNTIRYKITNLGKAYAGWGVTIENRDYYVNVDETTRKGSIPDTLEIVFENPNIAEIVRISMNKNGTYTSYLGFKK